MGWVNDRGEALREQWVNCSRCKYRLVVLVPPGEDWRVEAQCPSCDAWACFTIANTPEREAPPPDPREREREIQRLGEQLWQPINEHRGHPAVAWIDRVGNGVFEDDHSERCWPIPSWVYRFTRKGRAADIWQKGGSWFVRGWHPLRGQRPPEPEEMFSFAEALDRLTG
jgi:hypothetical protein